jgi:hypothetical protein
MVNVPAAAIVKDDVAPAASTFAVKFVAVITPLNNANVHPFVVALLVTESVSPTRPVIVVAVTPVTTSQFALIDAGDADSAAAGPAAPTKPQPRTATHTPATNDRDLDIIIVKINTGVTLTSHPGTPITQTPNSPHHHITSPWRVPRINTRIAACEKNRHSTL